MTPALANILLRSPFSPEQLPGMAARYDASDITSMRNNAGNIPASGDGIKLWGDKSGNSAVNCLVLNGVNGNNAVGTTATAFGTGNFTVSVKCTPVSLAAAMNLIQGGTSALAFFINTNGTLQTSLPSAGTNTASTGTVSAFAQYVLTYVRSSSTGTYYINAVSAGTTADSRDYSVAPLYMGSSSTATAVFNGNLQWVRHYSVALDATQVAADAAGTLQANSTFNVDFSLVSKLATSFTATTGGTVTINTSGDTGARICGARDLYQGTAANQPILTIAAGGDKLTFDGTNDYLKAGAFSLSQPVSAYFTGTQETWTLNDTILDGGAAVSSSIRIQQTSVTPQVEINAGAAAVGTISLTLQVRAIIAAVFNGASSSNRLNRGTAVTGNPGTNAPNGVTIGDRQVGGAPANITANEVAIYSAAHDEGTQNRIIDWAWRKWIYPL